MSICEEPEQSTDFVHFTATLNEGIVGWVTDATEESEKLKVNVYVCPEIKGLFEESAI